MDAKIKKINLSAGLYKITVEAVDAAAQHGMGVTKSSIIITPAQHSLTTLATFLGPTRDFVELNESFAVVILQVYQKETVFNLISLTAVGGIPLTLRVENLQFKTETVDKNAMIADADVNTTAAKEHKGNKLICHRSGVGDVASPAENDLNSHQLKTVIEGFNVLLDGNLKNLEVEYKALAFNGSETVWTKSGQYCGSRGQHLPLLGVAFRARSSSSGIRYECEYQLQFLSGALSGVGRNGVPIKSIKPSDPITHISLKVQAVEDAQSLPKTTKKKPK